MKNGKFLWIYVVAMPIILLTTYIFFSPNVPIIPILFGDKTQSLLDCWSFQHFFSGVLFGYFCWNGFESKLSIGFDEWILRMLFIAFTWEACELILETGLFFILIDIKIVRSVICWKGGVEHWSNRILADPLCFILGGLVCEKYRWIIKPAIFFTIIWLAINILSPNCMYIQRIFFSP